MNLATAFLAAALLEIFSEVGEIIRVDRKQRMLFRLFGIEDRKAGVAIVLPKFEVDAHDIRAKQTEGWNDLKSHGRLIAPDQDVIGVAVQSDTMAASDLIAMFSGLGLNAPKVMWDDEALKHFDNPSSRFRSFITIGIASNALAMRINDESYGHRFFKLGIDTKPGMTVDPAEGAEGPDLTIWKLSLATLDPTNTAVDTDPTKWTEYVDEKWGLISKVVMPGTRKCVFLLAGIHSEGTRRLGNFIATNWQSILNWTDSSVSDRRVDSNSFASLVEIPLDPNGVIGTNRQVLVDPRSR